MTALIILGFIVFAAVGVWMLNRATYELPYDAQKRAAKRMGIGPEK